MSHHNMFRRFIRPNTEQFLQIEMHDCFFGETSKTGVRAYRGTFCYGEYFRKLQNVVTGIYNLAACVIHTRSCEKQAIPKLDSTNVRNSTLIYWKAEA